MTDKDRRCDGCKFSVEVIDNDAKKGQRSSSQFKRTDEDTNKLLECRLNSPSVVVVGQALPSSSADGLKNNTFGFIKSCWPRVKPDNFCFQFVKKS